jgi:hypothetical protein
MYRSTFYIAEMDCPSEEHLIRMKLADDKSVSHLDFDIDGRTL